MAGVLCCWQSVTFQLNTFGGLDGNLHFNLPKITRQLSIFLIVNLIGRVSGNMRGLNQKIQLKKNRNPICRHNPPCLPVGSQGLSFWDPWHVKGWVALLSSGAAVGLWGYGGYGRGRVESPHHLLMWDVCEPVFALESRHLGSNTKSRMCNLSWSFSLKSVPFFSHISRGIMKTMVI